MTAAIGAGTQPQEILTVSFNPTGFDRKVNGHRSCLHLVGGEFLLFDFSGCQLPCYLKTSCKARRKMIWRNFGFTALRCVQNWGWAFAGAVCSVSWICVAGAACHPLRAIQRAAKILPALPPATAPGVHRWTHGWRRTNWAAPQKSPGCPWRCPCFVHGTNVFAIPCLYFVGIMLSAVHHRTRSS